MRNLRNTGWRRRLAGAAAFLALALLCPRPGAAQNTPPPRLHFPDMELEAKDGGSIRISQLKGNVVLVNFWATWCGPCRMELPLLQDLYNRYSDKNFTVLAVSVDSDRNRVDPFLRAHNLTLPVYYGHPEETDPMISRGIPTSFILTPAGDVEKIFVGYEPNIERHWSDFIDKYIRKKKKSKG